MSKNSKDALQICVAYVSERLRHHDENMNNAPFFLGVNGVQGIGKSYLVSGMKYSFILAQHWSADAGIGPHVELPSPVYLCVGLRASTLVKSRFAAFLPYFLLGSVSRT